MKGYLHVKSTIQVHGQLEVVAIAFVFSVPLSPEVADRRALKARINEEPYAVGKKCCNDDPADV